MGKIIQRDGKSFLVRNGERTDENCSSCGFPHNDHSRQYQYRTETMYRYAAIHPEGNLEWPGLFCSEACLWKSFVTQEIL